jgi:hypothetical protein
MIFLAFDEVIFVVVTFSHRMHMYTQIVYVGIANQKVVLHFAHFGLVVLSSTFL